MQLHLVGTLAFHYIFLFSFLVQSNLLFDLAWRPRFCDEETHLINNNNNNK